MNFTLPRNLRPLKKAITKISMRDRIYSWLVDHQMHSPGLDASFIRQTNHTFNKRFPGDNYYFEYGNVWVSDYTMKRWLEIAEGGLYEEFEVTASGAWHWLTNTRSEQGVRNRRGTIMN